MTSSGLLVLGKNLAGRRMFWVVPGGSGRIWMILSSLRRFEEVLGQTWAKYGPRATSGSVRRVIRYTIAPTLSKAVNIGIVPSGCEHLYCNCLAMPLTAGDNITLPPPSTIARTAALALDLWPSDTTLVCHGRPCLK